MPRRPRLVIPGIPMHITQRGVNRASIFFGPGDYRRYLDLLAEVTASHGIPVHTYALMGNHVHLLITPNDEGGIAHAMRLLNQRYVAGFNRKHGRTGTLWESRFRSCLVESERYLLAVYRYIDLNPVRAGLVDEAGNYPWSGARANLGLGTDRCVTPHALYLAFGADPAACAARYREWIDAGIRDEELAQLRAYDQQQRALGSPQFQRRIEHSLGRPVALRAPGRPRNPVNGSVEESSAGVSNG